MTASTSQTEVLYSTLTGDPDLGELVAMFVDEMPNRIQTLRRAYDAQDREALRRTAHQLKGAAGSYGFDQITSPAAALESSIDSDKSEEETTRCLEELVSLCQRISAGTPQ